MRPARSRAGGASLRVTEAGAKSDMDRPAQKKDARPRLRDRCGLVLQILLGGLGLHMLLAIGFTVPLGGDVQLIWRHPIAGLLVILLGFASRWLVSPAFRDSVRRNRAVDLEAIRRFAAHGAKVPWRPALAWVFLGALLIYLANDRYIGTGDTRPMLPTAHSVVHDRDVALDEFVDSQDPPYYVTQVGGHFYSLYSLGPAVLAVPFVAAAELLGADLAAGDHLWRLDKLVAALLASATVMFVFLSVLQLSPPPAAVFLTIFFAAGSQNWVISSQALWQHGPVALCAVTVIFIELRRGERLSAIGAALQGALLGFAVACRPTAALLVLAWLVLTLWRRPRLLSPFVLGAAIAYGPFLIVHLHVYESVLGPYQRALADRAWNLAPGAALAGNLVSPARGLLVYQPLLALAALAIVPRWARRIGVPLTVTLLGWCAAHLLVVSSFRMWWGGHCWGPRFLTEIMPALTILCVPAVERFRARVCGRGVLAVVVGWSILLQAVGTLDPKAHRWLSDPTDIDRAPERLWDWRDPPFLFRLRGLRQRSAAGAARTETDGTVHPPHPSPYDV